MTWEIRLKIALGTSKGLQYLHTNNIFGCVRPRNILLTHDFQPRVRYELRLISFDLLLYLSII